MPVDISARRPKLQQRFEATHIAPATADQDYMKVDRRWLATRVAIVLLALQITVAGAQLWERNINQDGWGSLPFSWQMYSGKTP